MSDLLPFIVIGLVIGSIYGLAGSGLVLTYKTSGIFNFAHGSIATLSAFVFFELWVRHGLPWPVGFVISVFVLGPIIGLAMERFARLLADASHVLKIAAMIGIVTAVIGIGNIWYGSETRLFPSFLPTSTVRIFGVEVSWGQITVVLIALGAAGGLYYFLRYTRLGMSMRAVVDDADLMAISGISPVRVRQLAWVIGSTFAALSGVLIAPSLSLNGLILTQLVVQAFGAAAIGYFSSLPATYVGGLVVGVAGSITTKFVVNVPSLVGLPPGIPFLILFVVLIVTPQARLAVRRYVPNRRLAEPYTAPPVPRVLTGVVAIVLLALVPTIVGTKLTVYSSGLIDVILFLSLGLLVRLSGQVSLCQYGFAAIGAAAMGHLTHDAHLPWLLAFVLAGLIAIPIGALLAIPAARLSGVFLALATFGFGVLLESMFYTMNFMFGPTSEGIEVRRPRWRLGPWDMSTDRGFYFLILLCTVLAALAVIAVMRSRLGRILRAMADSPLALETLSVSVNVSRVLVFCIAAMLASFAGALSGSLFTFAVGTGYPSFGSLTLLALLVIIPLGAPWYAVVAAASLEVIPAYIPGSNVTNYLSILFGVSAVLAPITLARHPGAPMAVRRLASKIDALVPRRRRVLAPVVTEPRAVRGDGLRVEALTVTYRGVTAVEKLTFSAPTNSITGMIGPNGAGKTTSFNACSGLVKATTGKIMLHGEDVSHLAPAARARRGLGRTFQRVELFDSMSVRENVALGYEGSLAGRNPLRHLASSRLQQRAVAAACDQAIELCGLSSLADARAGDISTGQRRLVELARVLAGPYDLILLDEPSSGLDPIETSAFGEVLAGVVRERHIGILLVEHDMDLIRQVCDHVFVLDFGHLIFEGDVDGLMSNEVVQSAYLGSTSTATADLAPVGEPSADGLTV